VSGVEILIGEERGVKGGGGGFRTWCKEEV